jgi:hypothetical protein
MSDNISASSVSNLVSNLTKPDRCEYCKVVGSKCHKKIGGPGFVYCLSNQSLHTKEGKPLYKIGLADDMKTRMAELFTTGLPTPFVLEFAKYVPCMWDFEQKLHKHFAKYRFNKNREFFTREIDEIKHVFDTWLPGPFLTKLEDCEKMKINVLPSDVVVVASNEASVVTSTDSSTDSSTDYSTDFSSIVSDVDLDIDADVTTEDADVTTEDADVTTDVTNEDADAAQEENATRLDEDELVEIQLGLKKNQLERCWFNRKTRELFDFDDNSKLLEDDNGKKIESLATFVSRYCKKHNIIKNGKAQHSYTSCKYEDKETKDWVCCDKSFKKNK